MMRRLTLLSVVTFAVFLTAQVDARAETCTYSGIGSWHTALSWMCTGGNHVPTAADTAEIDTGASVTVNEAQAPGALTLNGGDITFSGGPVLSVAGAVSVTGGAISGGGTLLLPSGATFSKTSGGTLTVGNAAHVTLDVDWAQSAGAITVDLGGTFGGTGAGAISGGTFTVNGTLAGPVTLTGGILAGTGQINGAVTNTSGIIRPGGLAAGRLTVNGALTLGGSGTLEITVSGTTPGTGFDVLAVNGVANLSGTVTVGSSVSPAITDGFQFLTSPTPGGAFLSLNAPPLDAGRVWQLDYPSTAPLGARLLLQPPVFTQNIDFPAITSGALAIGVVMSCSPGTWTKSPTLTYQWLRDDVPISGATTSTHAMVFEDALHSLVCRVTGTTTGGSTSATSSPRGMPGVPPTNTVLPTVTIDGLIGGTATCTPGSWLAAPEPTFTYQWIRDGLVVAGADGPTYTITAADIATELACVANAENGEGSKGVTSVAKTIAPIPPVNTTAPTVSGKSSLGSTLTCTSGGWTGTPPPALSIEWLRAGTPIEGEAQPTYQLVAADGNRAVGCRVTATNKGGAVQAVSSTIKVAKNAEQRLAARSSADIATAFGMPSSKACRKPNSSFTFRVLEPTGVTIKLNSVKVNLAGKKNKIKTVRERVYETTIDVRKVKKRKTFVVSLTVKSITPLTFHAKRTYKVCK